MAPGYRTATQTRRGNRSGYPEHDDFEGLPVRQWRQETMNIAPPPSKETTRVNDRWAMELPYGMPKDYQLLAPHSQDLLLAARSGRLYKRPAPLDDEDADGDANGGERVEKKEEVKEATPDGYTVKLWRPLPRNTEGPAISHLAKRHKGTVLLASKAVLSQSNVPTVTRAIVRRLDAAGNPYEQTVTLTDGQQVNGEIISTSVVLAPSAVNGDTASQQTTPARRKPPPPRKKAKGPGRGRKKKLLPLPLPAPNGTVVNGTAGANAENGDQTIKDDNDNDAATNQDSEMADNSMPPSDEEEGDEGDEGDDGDEDDETPDRENDVDEEHEQDRDHSHDQDLDHEMEDSHLTAEMTEASASPDTAKGESVDEDDMAAPKRPMPVSPLNLAPPHAAMRLASPQFEGSPLKNVVMRSPTEASPNTSPLASHFPPAPSFESRIEMAMEIDDLGEPAQPIGNQITESANITEVAIESGLTSSESIPPSSQGLVSEVEIQPVTMEGITEERPTLAEAQEIVEQVSAAEEVPLEESRPEPVPTVPAVEELVVEEPVVEEPVVEVPVVEVPVVEEPVVEKPVVENPMVEEPVVEEPPAELPKPAQEPASDKTPVEVTDPVVAAKVAPEEVLLAQEERAPSPEPIPQDPTPPPPRSPPLPPTTLAEEDEGPDLLGGLEAELDRQAESSSERPAASVPEVEPLPAPITEPPAPAPALPDSPPPAPQPVPAAVVTMALPDLRGGAGTPEPKDGSAEDS